MWQIPISNLFLAQRACVLLLQPLLDTIAVKEVLNVTGENHNLVFRQDLFTAYGACWALLESIHAKTALKFHLLQILFQCEDWETVLQDGIGGFRNELLVCIG